MDQNLSVFTIGHSALPYFGFVGLLKAAKVELLADVRSQPYSRRSPHFNREELSESLKSDGVRYVFLGDLLGGRPRGKRFYCEGVADYEQMSRTKDFEEGISYVLQGAERKTLALMCSEHNPLDCHRCLLVGRALIDKEVQVAHILHSGEIKSQVEIEADMLDELANENSLFAPNDGGDALATAYRRRSKKVAYRLLPAFKSVAAE